MLGRRLNPMGWTLRLAAIGLAVSLSVAASAEPPSQDGLDLYFSHVRPLFRAKCIQCHGPDEQKGKLRLDSVASIRMGGKHGPAIKPGEPAASLLLKTLRHEGEIKMPPKERVSDEAVKQVDAWIRSGAAMADPVQILWEDEEGIIGALAKGDGRCELDRQDKAAGVASLVIGRQREANHIAGWKFAIREKPDEGEFRFIRFAWKKRGGGAMMLEVARGGEWRKQDQKNGAWIAGKNTTGWAAHEVSADAPSD